jgi:hypothetical protein
LAALSRRGFLFCTVGAASGPADRGRRIDE